VVVTGAAEDKAEAAAVAEAGALDLAGRTSLPELADVVDRAAVLVVGNTAPAHLAAAVQTPVVSPVRPRSFPPRRGRPTAPGCGCSATRTPAARGAGPAPARFPATPA